MNYDFEFATLPQLDVLFFTSFANRSTSPIVNYHVTDGAISEEELSNLSAEILSVYRQKWDKLKAVAELDYDPIHNFYDNIHETIDTENDYTKNNTGTVTDTGNVKDTGTVKDTGSVANTGTQATVGERTNTGTQGTAETENKTVADTTYGFNSATHTGKDDESVNRTDNTTRTDNLTENTSSTRTDNLTQTNNLTHTNDLTRTNNLTRTDNLTETLDEDVSRVRDVIRSGNIGNLSTQSLLKQEIELWQWNFINQVLQDVKEFTTLAIYDSERR